MQQGSLSHLSPIFKLMILFLIVISFGMLSGWIIGVLAELVFGIDVTNTESVQSHVGFMRMYQIVQSISLFIVPPLIAFYLFFKRFKEGVQGKGKWCVETVLLTVVMIIFGQGFISFSGWLNHQLILPEGWGHILEWMTSKEQEAGELTVLMIQADHWWQILITVFMFSILPAIGEEWFFRGLLQRQLGLILKNPHVAIVLTAIIFSAGHMQFLTFLPRFFLGLILGYLFYYSRNLWVPVIGHFTNNFMAVVLYMTMSSHQNESPLDIPNHTPNAFAVLFSFVVIVLILFYIERQSRIKKV